MNKFDFNRRPYYPNWGEPIKPYYENTYKNIFVILNPFIVAPINIKSYPSYDLIVNDCEELKWKHLILMSEMQNFNEINYALITNGLQKELQNRTLNNKLYNFCELNSIFYPSDGNFSPFNIKKIITLLRKLDVSQITILSEFGEVSGIEDKELNSSNFNELENLNLQTATLLSNDKNLFLTNHWDSFMTILATNYNINKAYLENFNFEVLIPDENFKLDNR